MIYTKENGVWVKLPAPESITINDEIIWSSNTGRTSTGKMIGDVIAEKNTYSINWGLMEERDYKKIKNSIVSGFIPLKIKVDSEAVEITAYRGTLTARARGCIGNTYYYDSIATELIEQ